MVVLRDISASTRVRVEFDRAQQVVDDDPSWLLDAASDGTLFRMDVWAARQVGQPDEVLPVQVQLGPGRDVGNARTRDIRWWPVAGEHALSHFDGALRLRPADGLCQVELAGQYLVPPSLTGVFGGGLAGHRSARRSLGVLVDQIAARLVSS